MSKKNVLKSSIAVVLLGFVLCMSSCKKEEKQIIGKWKAESIIVTELACSDPVMTMMLKPRLSHFFEDSDSAVEYEFTKDGKATVKIDDEEDLIETATYKVNGNKLSLTFKSMTQTYDLSFPNKKTMQWDMDMDKNMLALYSMIIAMSSEFEDLDLEGLNVTKLTMRTLFKKL